MLFYTFFNHLESLPVFSLEIRERSVVIGLPMHAWLLLSPSSLLSVTMQFMMSLTIHVVDTIMMQIGSTHHTSHSTHHPPPRYHQPPPPQT
jgi:hypothetical protein